MMDHLEKLKKFREQLPENISPENHHKQELSFHG